MLCIVTLKGICVFFVDITKDAFFVFLIVFFVFCLYTTEAVRLQL